jgi:glycerophosphoryl diester phosphodiesterase
MFLLAIVTAAFTLDMASTSRTSTTSSASGAAASGQARSAPAMPWLVAHRGASAYAPENTVPAFQLAAQQGATFVEFDLQLTRDKQVVCLHDNSLERTTDVEEVFPDRSRPAAGGGGARTWMLEDFTLAEIKRLDAGAWFDAKFRGTRIPTFGETIEALRGRSGLFIEVKSPERYEGIERLIMAELRSRGLDTPWADARTPVLLQSFNADSLKIFAGALKTTLPIHFLFGARDAARWMTPEGLQQIKSFSTGISPEKSAVAQHQDAMQQARKLGLLITPYTFRASAVTGYPDVTAEMRHYLETLRVDGVITDNPDLAPAKAR